MLAISQLSMRFGAKILFKDVSLQFNPGHHYGLIGANGSGKSTLIKILAGELTPEGGDVSIPQQVSLGSLSQDHYRFENDLIIDVVLRGRKRLWEALEKKKLLLTHETFTDEECHRLDDYEKTIAAEGGYAAEGEAAKLLEGLGIRDDVHRKPLSVLSGGYKLRVLLAQVLFGHPDILVLDEPTNHLDLYSICWLEGYLRNFPGTLIVTSHDRDFLNNICTHIVDVDYGTIRIYKGNYDDFQEQKRLAREQNEHMLEKQERRRADLQEFIDRFGAKATKARQAQSKARIVEQIKEEIEGLDLTPSSRLYPKIHFHPLRASGVKALEVKGISKSYGPKKVLEKVTFEIERGERVAIIGPNGIGKSTLLEVLNDRQTSDAGEYAWGFAARIAYFPQDHVREVRGGGSLLDWLSQFDRNASQEQLRDLLGRVLFSGDTVHQSVSTLSGGETARLLIAKMMLLQPNILIFDEPTNHLDMEAIDELARSLESYEGTLLFVSHNRYFVSRIANRIIEISNLGVKDFKGTYQEYLDKQEKDHLSTQLILSRRYVNESPIVKGDAPSSYTDQKKLKSQKAQLKKKTSHAEDECHRLEKKIGEIDALFASEEFYQNRSLEEQQRLAQQKLELEASLLEAMEAWEKAGLELQQAEEGV